MSQLLHKGNKKKLVFFFPLTFYFLLLTFYVPRVPGLVNWDAVAQAQTVPPEVRQGYTLLGRGLVRDAIKGFQQAVRRYPQSLEAKLGLAIAYRRQGLLTEAWSAYQQVLAQAPTNQLALKTVGLLGTYRPEWQVRGIEALTTLLNLNPGDTEARSLRGLLYGYQQRFAEALADYQIVLQTNSSPDVLLGAAQTYTNSGNYQQGLELFNRYQATGGKPIVDYAAVSYARALRETGNAPQAVQVLEVQLRKSKKLDNLAIQTRAELSRAYLANQQITEALAVLDPLQGRPDAVLPLARSLNEIRRVTNDATLANQVANLYRQALTQPNLDPRVVREVADVFTGLPQGEQTALQLYRQLTASQPNDRSLLVQQLALENKLGLISKADLNARLATALQILPTQPSEQQQLAQALIQIDPPNPELLSAYQSLQQAGANVPFLNFRIAQILVQRNDLAGAKTALAAYAATPQGARDLAPQLLAADIERLEGNLAASAQRYQALIALNPADSDIVNSALRGLAGLRLAQNRPDEALALYDQLVARNPQDLTLQLGRASIGYQAQRFSKEQAEAVLNSWLQTQPATDAPPELFALVGTLPAEPQREALYNALLQFDPNNIPIQVRLVQVIAARNPGQAKALVSRLVARDPTNIGNYFVQGQVAQSIGDLDLADQAYQTILAAQPDNADALSALGGIRFQQRRFESAEQLYSQVLAFRPDDTGIRRTLASLSAAQDRPLEAMEQLERLQLEQVARGTPNSEVARQMQQLEEDFLRRRGFQPSWERYP